VLFSKFSQFGSWLTGYVAFGLLKGDAFSCKLVFRFMDTQNLSLFLCTYDLPCFNRFPKKLERSLLDVRRTTEIEKDVIGWGVHIIEGPNLLWITLLTLIVVVISGIVSVVYSIAMNDVSGGFGIGAWIIAFWVALVTALYFQWKQT
jgi:hypothetical protein